jgi:hypothetical protein
VSDEEVEPALVGPTGDPPQAPVLDLQNLPDRWCFGLAHPYIQRLVFLAGALERNAEDIE